MSHANAALTPGARLRLARLIVDDGWPPSVAAKMFMVSTVTARKWATRFRTEGAAGMQDRSSRPHSMPTKTPLPLVKRIVKARWRRRLGPVQIAGELGVAPSTAHAVLVRCRINRLSRIDRVTGEPIRRYEHDHPGSLIHVDVTEVRQHPRRRRASLPRSCARHEESACDDGREPQRSPSAPARDRLPAHRHRGPLPRRLRPDAR